MNDWHKCSLLTIMFEYGALTSAHHDHDEHGGRHICNSYGIKFTQRALIPYANWAEPALAKIALRKSFRIRAKSEKSTLCFRQIKSRRAFVHTGRDIGIFSFSRE
jgi:hypothetical protein